MGLQSTRQIGGTTSLFARIFIGQATAPSQGVVGLTSGAGLTWYWIRAGGTTSSVQALTAGTTGTFAAGSFIQIDGVNLPGLYEVGIPNASITSGTLAVDHYIGGTAGICPVVYHIDIDPGSAFVALTQTTYAQPSAVIAATDTLVNKIGWMSALAQNKIMTTSSAQTLIQSGGTASISTTTVSDDGTTAIRGQWS